MPGYGRPPRPGRNACRRAVAGQQQRVAIARALASTRRSFWPTSRWRASIRSLRTVLESLRSAVSAGVSRRGVLDKRRPQVRSGSVRACDRYTWCGKRDFGTTVATPRPTRRALERFEHGWPRLRIEALPTGGSSAMMTFGVAARCARVRALLLAGSSSARVRPGREADRIHHRSARLPIGARERSRDHAHAGTWARRPTSTFLERGQPADQVELLEDQRELAARQAQLARALPDVAAGDVDRPVVPAGWQVRQRKSVVWPRRSAEHATNSPGRTAKDTSASAVTVGGSALSALGVGDEPVAVELGSYSSSVAAMRSCGR